MQAYEFPTKIDRDGRIDVPDDLKSVLPVDRNVRVILLVDETTDEQTEWNQLSAGQFLAGYAEADSIYDQHS
jgi:bifunctional DNA-binding transcriptional regulator/antitoxin component of YhaV-PrlF toxin-antitoxin module